MNVPIIRLEVEGMRRTIQTALMKRSALLDQDIAMAVDAYCTPDNISSVVQREALKAIDDAVKEEIRSFFSYSGNGRKPIKEAVTEHMDRYYSN